MASYAINYEKMADSAAEHGYNAAKTDRLVRRTPGWFNNSLQESKLIDGLSLERIAKTWGVQKSAFITGESDIGFKFTLNKEFIKKTDETANWNKKYKEVHGRVVKNSASEDDVRYLARITGTDPWDFIVSVRMRRRSFADINGVQPEKAPELYEGRTFDTGKLKARMEEFGNLPAAALDRMIRKENGWTAALLEGGDDEKISVTGEDIEAVCEALQIEDPEEILEPLPEEEEEEETAEAADDGISHTDPVTDIRLKKLEKDIAELQRDILERFDKIMERFDELGKVLSEGVPARLTKEDYELIDRLTVEQAVQKIKELPTTLKNITKEEIMRIVPHIREEHIPEIMKRIGAYYESKKNCGSYINPAPQEAPGPEAEADGTEEADK